MTERLYPNCWAPSRRLQAQAPVEQACGAWVQHWFGDTPWHCVWHWNEQLFGRMEQIHADPQQWSHLLAAVLVPGMASVSNAPWLPPLATQLQQDLAQRLGYALDDPYQAAAWCQLVLGPHVLWLPLPCQQLQTSPPQLQPLPTPLLEQLAAGWPIRLQVSVATQALCRQTVATLAKGQVIVLQHAVAEPLQLTSDAGVQLPCYLGRRDHQQVLVMK